MENMNGNGNGNSNMNVGSGGQATTIPDKSGAIQVTGLEAAVFEHKMMAGFLGYLEDKVDGYKTIFRKEAERRMRDATPGTKRVEFLDGKGGCVMVSPPDLSKTGSRRLIDTRLLQSVLSVLGEEAAAKFETFVSGVVTGALLDLCRTLARGEEAIVLTGSMVPWFRSVLQAQGAKEMPAEAVLVGGPEYGDQLEEDVQTRLKEDAAAEIQRLVNSGERMDSKVYDALRALVQNGIKASTVNVR